MVQKYAFSFILLIVIFPSYIHSQEILSESNFVLITTLYNETDDARREEYLTCLQNNINNNLIKKIHVLYDTAKDQKNNTIIYDFLIQNKITLTCIHGRPTYEKCFEIANSYPPNTKIIIANADIYFNETLEYLLHFDFSNVFIALTRWNVQKDGSLKIHKTYKNKVNPFSQDTWIFQTPLKKIKNSGIQLGTHHCDGKIAYQAKKAGLTLLNPCLTIQTCHLHLSNLRTYPHEKYPKEICQPIRWSKLLKIDQL